MYPRISINPNVCHGQACIKGTRIPVHQIIHTLANGDTNTLANGDTNTLANGDTIEELLTEYPSLEPEDILTCLDYAASLAEEQVTPTQALASTDEDLRTKTYR